MPTFRSRIRSGSQSRRNPQHLHYLATHFMKRITAGVRPTAVLKPAVFYRNYRRGVKHSGAEL